MAGGPEPLFISKMNPEHGERLQPSGAARDRCYYVEVELGRQSCGHCLRGGIVAGIERARHLRAERPNMISGPLPAHNVPSVPPTCPAPIMAIFTASSAFIMVSRGKALTRFAARTDLSRKRERWNFYGRIESSNGVRDNTSAPVAVISTCCSNFTPSVPPASPR